MGSSDFAEKLNAIRKSEPVFGAEFICRTILVVLTAATGWLVMELEFLPFWLLAYYTLVLFEKYLLARSASRPRRAWYLAIVVVSFFIASTFAVLPIWLWNMEGEIWKFAAMVALVGGTLNVFLLRARTQAVAIAYLVPLTSVPFILSHNFFVAPWGGPGFWSAFILSVCFAVYLGVGVRESNRTMEEVRLTQKKYHQAQKRDALGTLTAGISHDFNNLLSVVLGSLELIRTRQFPKSEEDVLVEEAISATKRGAELTRTLLAYAKGSELELDFVNPVEVVDQVVLLGRRVLVDGTGLSSKTDVRPGHILTDGPLLQSALLNLIINARDAIASGGKIELCLRESLREGVEMFEFSVRDNGVGIPEHDLERVTEPFFSTKALGEGSGLGLSMVFGFAQQSDGEFRLESSQGIGTTAYLLLPKAKPGSTSSQDFR